jgi:hypothetical protein
MAIANANASVILLNIVILLASKPEVARAVVKSFIWNWLWPRCFVLIYLAAISLSF